MMYFDGRHCLEADLAALTGLLRVDEAFADAAGLMMTAPVARAATGTSGWTSAQKHGLYADCVRDIAPDIHGDGNDTKRARRTRERDCSRLWLCAANAGLLLSRANAQLKEYVDDYVHRPWITAWANDKC
jgi:hypothetical protein